MTIVDPSAAACARRFLAQGWKPGERPGEISHSSDRYAGAINLVDDDVWRVMAMLTLEVR